MHTVTRQPALSAGLAMVHRAAWLRSVVAPPACIPQSALLPFLQSRVLHGVRPEILALSEIPFVKAFTARLLYRAGLRCAGLPGRLPELVAVVPYFGACSCFLRDIPVYENYRCVGNFHEPQPQVLVNAWAAAALGPRPTIIHAPMYCCRRTPEAVAAVENVDQIVSILSNQQGSNT